MPRAKIDWPPEIPAKFQNVLKPFTPYAGGWCRWYKNKMRHVCGRGTAFDQIEERWAEKKRAIDLGILERVQQAKAGGITMREAASLFFEWLDGQVQQGKMSAYTAADYNRDIVNFARFVGGDRALASLEQSDFGAYAKAFEANAPSTLNRVIAYVQSFLTWCHDEGHLKDLPRYGRSFVKASLQERRDKRLAEEKSYSIEQLQKLWKVATLEERVWLALGLNGALDNSDLANLSEEVIDRKTGVLDYSRRKKGKIRRVIPLRPETLELLEEYTKTRAAPAAPDVADRLLLTPTGLPLSRLKENESTGRFNPIDYVAMKWTRLMIRAELRAALPARRRVGRKNKPDDPARERRRKARGSKSGQGFRAIRTTFPNLAPAGYRMEVEIIMGHTQGGVLLENYLEKFGVTRLRELVDHVWESVGLKWPLPPDETSAESPTVAASSASPAPAPEDAEAPTAT